MSYVVQNIVKSQHSRNRLTVQSRLNSLPEQDWRKDRVPNNEQVASNQDDESPWCITEEASPNRVNSFMEDYAVVLRDALIVVVYFSTGIIYYYYHERWPVAKSIYFIVVSSKCKSSQEKQLTIM